MRDFIRSDEYGIRINQNLFLELEQDTYEPILQTLTHRKWMLNVAADDAGYFITTVARASRLRSALIANHAVSAAKPWKLACITVEMIGEFRSHT